MRNERHATVEDSQLDTPPWMRRWKRWCRMDPEGTAAFLAVLRTRPTRAVPGTWGGLEEVVAHQLATGIAVSVVDAHGTVLLAPLPVLKGIPIRLRYDGAHYAPEHGTVPGDGNCLFHALVSYTPVVSHVQLRFLTQTVLEELSTL